MCGLAALIRHSSGPSKTVWTGLALEYSWKSSLTTGSLYFFIIFNPLLLNIWEEKGAGYFACLLLTLTQLIQKLWSSFSDYFKYIIIIRFFLNLWENIRPFANCPSLLYAYYWFESVRMYNVSWECSILRFFSDWPLK